MKVLVFMTQFYQLGGAERLGLELAEDLNKRGIHADIMSLYTHDLPGVPEATLDLFNRGIPAVRFLGLRIHPSIATLITAIPRLRRLIQTNHYDIVETSALSPTVIAAWATRGTKARHIAGIHRVFSGNQDNSRQHKLLRLSVRLNQHVRYYAISDYVAARWIRYSGTSPMHTHRIYNAIPDKSFAPAHDDARQRLLSELGLAADVRIAIYVGRITPAKGIDTLIEALGPILREENMVLLCVGAPDLHTSGTAEMLLAMERRLGDTSWGERVRFLGFRQDASQLIACCDVLVHPSRTEGFGLVLVEAMAAGVPIVASNVDGIPEVLALTDSLMTPPDDPGALRTAVLRTLNRTPDDAAAAITKGRQRAQAFRATHRTDQMVRLFADLLDASRPT